MGKSHLREIASDPCPRCGGIYEKGAAECGSCGLIFAKYQNRAPQTGVRSSPELEAAWQGVLADFGNEAVHKGFIDLCFAKNNVLFASQKYRNYLEANPSDPMAIQMRDLIISKVTVIFMARAPTDRPAPNDRFRKFLFFSVGMGVILLLASMFVPRGHWLAVFGLLILVAGAGISLMASRMDS